MPPRILYPVPQEAPTPTLPLYSEEWVEELLSRVFAIITNLDSPEHRGELQQHAAFLSLDLGCFGLAVMCGGAAFRFCAVITSLDLPEHQGGCCVSCAAAIVLR